MITTDKLERISKLKNNLLSSKYELCIERLRYYTEMYKEFPKDPENIKRAKSLAHTLKNMKIFIRDDELLVGNETSKNLGEKLNLDYSCDNSFEKKSTYKKLSRRKIQPFLIQEEEIDEVLEMIPFWKGRALVEDYINKKLFKEGYISSEGMIDSLAPNIAIQTGTTEGHISAGYEKLLNLGYYGIFKEASKMQENLDTNDKDFQKKYDFYEAVKIYYQAAREFSRRYSSLASTLVKGNEDAIRKGELSKIAQMMEKFYSHPPSTFYEAVQFIWFSQNIANIIFQRSVVALGRLDQLLWPYYIKDLKEGLITKEFALELIEELNLKLTWNVTLLPTDFTMVANAIGQNTQTITVGGLDKEGNDITNELSYIFLHAYANVKAFTTDLSVRISDKTPKEFFLEAIKVFKSTSGIAFYNDEIIIPSLIESGYALEDARDYVIIGCVEPTGQGNSFAATGRMFLNLPGVLELVLNNGYSNLSKRIDGLQTGEISKFISFEQFYDAFVQQLQFNIKKSVAIAAIGDQEAMKYFQHPYISATVGA